MLRTVGVECRGGCQQSALLDRRAAGFPENGDSDQFPNPLITKKKIAHCPRIPTPFDQLDEYIDTINRRSGDFRCVAPFAKPHGHGFVTAIGPQRV
jgi:hypothetical protein